jgi:hypothetical protein
MLLHQNVADLPLLSAGLENEMRLRLEAWQCLNTRIEDRAPAYRSCAFGKKERMPAPSVAYNRSQSSPLAQLFE